MSADTIVPEPDAPQSFNRYSYTLNNPLKYTDPTGHYVANANIANDCRITNACDIGGDIVDAHQDPAEVAQNRATAGEIGQITLSVLCELCDWALAASDGIQLHDAVGLIPFIPAAAGRWGDDALQTAGRYVDDVVAGFCSFSSDTMVSTERGFKQISEVELHDEVLAYDEVTGEIGYYPVMAIWAHEDQLIVTLTVDGETIETTSEHPFYTVDGEWVAAGDLQVGRELREADWGVGTVEAVSFTLHPEVMYNFTVATAHTYFVGEGQWLVHNSCRQVFDDLIDGQQLATNEVLRRGQEFVGDNPLQVSEGVFVSSQPIEGNIYAMFRVTDSDIMDGHANFELVSRIADPVTGRVRYIQTGQNKHIFFSDVP